MPPEEEKQRARLVVDAHSTNPDINVLLNRDVVFTSETSVPSIQYHHLRALNDKGISFDEVYLLPAPSFHLRLRQDNFWYFFGQEIGNEECGVFTREEAVVHGPHTTQYLAQDGTWKSWNKGYGFPKDAIRIKIFSPRSPS